MSALLVSYSGTQGARIFVCEGHTRVLLHDLYIALQGMSSDLQLFKSSAGLCPGLVAVLAHQHIPFRGTIQLQHATSSGWHCPEWLMAFKSTACPITRTTCPVFIINKIPIIAFLFKTLFPWFLCRLLISGFVPNHDVTQVDWRQHTVTKSVGEFVAISTPWSLSHAGLSFGTSFICKNYANSG